MLAAVDINKLESREEFTKLLTDQKIYSDALLKLKIDAELV
jgi:hypothetical protein